MDFKSSYILFKRPALNKRHKKDEVKRWKRYTMKKLNNEE